MRSNLSALINKYALVLSLTYVIAFGIGVLIKSNTRGEITEDMLSQGLAQWGASIALNALTALMVALDIRKYAIKTRYVLVATILFRPVGVIAMLLFLAQQENKNLENMARRPK